VQDPRKGSVVFKSKTVFVLGAGASNELDVPVGNELTSNIAGLLNIHVRFQEVEKGDAAIFRALQDLVNNDPAGTWANNTLIQSSHHISEAMELAPSIDTFLETFALDEERKLLGKLGIVRAILLAERGSKLQPTNDRTEPFRMKRVTDTWYVRLAQLLFTGLAAGNVSEVFCNTSFVVFNYDRCLQIFLVRALVVYFQLTEGQAEEIVKKAKILHPYGNLGSIFQGDRDRLPFGTDAHELAAAADRIKLYTESLQENDVIVDIRTAIKEAETIVFLGFAFHEQNMHVLSPPAPKTEKQSAVRRVLATTYGVSDPDVKLIRAQIATTLRGRPQKERDDYTIDTFTGKCAQFFAEYWRSFTSAV
jgi:hypothetical protein